MNVSPTHVIRINPRKNTPKIENGYLNAPKTMEQQRKIAFAITIPKWSWLVQLPIHVTRFQSVLSDFGAKLWLANLRYNIYNLQLQMHWTYWSCGETAASRCGGSTTPTSPSFTSCSSDTYGLTSYPPYSSSNSPSSSMFGPRCAEAILRMTYVWSNSI